MPRRRDQKRKARAKAKRAETRSKKNKKKVTRKEARAAMTANGKIIKDFMDEEGLKGDYRDHVIITGNRLIDYQGSYTIAFGEGQEMKDKMYLLHKSKLVNVLTEEMAAKLWHPKLGRIGAK